MGAARRRWKPPRVFYADFSSVIDATTTSASHTVSAHNVLLSAKTLTINQTASRMPLSRPNLKAVVRSIGDRNSGRAGVLRARSHAGESVQTLIDVLLITVVGIFIVVVVAAVTLSRRRRRAVVASRSSDEFNVDEDDDDCVELEEFVTELDDSSHNDAETTRYGLGSPAGWSVEDDREVLGDVTSLTPLCIRSTSSAASSITSGSTPSDTPLYCHTLSL